MKKIILFSIIVAAQQHAAEHNESIKKPEEQCRIHRVYENSGKTIVPFTSQKSDNTSITVTEPSKTNVSQDVLSAEAARIIATAEAVLKNKKGRTSKEFQQTKNACFRALKSTTNAYERAELANVHARFYQN